MQLRSLLFTSTLLLSFGTFFINADTKCGQAALTYDRPRDQVIVKGLTDYAHRVPFMSKSSNQNLILLADDLCRLFVTCKGFNAEERAVQVPKCEQVNRAVVEQAVSELLSYPAAVKMLETSINELINSQ